MSQNPGLVQLHSLGGWSKTSPLPLCSGSFPRLELALPAVPAASWVSSCALGTERSCWALAQLRSGCSAARPAGRRGCVATSCAAGVRMSAGVKRAFPLAARVAPPLPSPCVRAVIPTLRQQFRSAVPPSLGPGLPVGDGRGTCPASRAQPGGTSRCRSRGSRSRCRSRQLGRLLKRNRPRGA